MKSFLKQIIAKTWPGYDAIEWLEEWISDIKDPPSPDIIESLKEASPKRSLKLYRGISVGNYKTPEKLIRALAGKKLELGESFSLHSDQLSSWSKDLDAARSFAFFPYSGGYIKSHTKGIVLEAIVPPSLILVDITRVSGIDSALRQDVLEEKEVIVLPGTVQTRYIMKSK
jgi:hypothetical protein